MPTGHRGGVGCLRWQVECKRIRRKRAYPLLDEDRKRDADANGAWGRPETSDLMQGLVTRAAPMDTDGDGMPDAWERRHGLNPRTGADHNHLMVSDYTAIEEYARECATQRIGSLSSAGRKD